MIDDSYIKRLHDTIIKNCTLCGGSGKTVNGPCECQIEFRAVNRMITRGFMEEYLMLDQSMLPKLDLSEQDRNILNFYSHNSDAVRDQGLSLYIYGEQVGPGKTSLAVLLAKQYSKYNLSEDNYMWEFDSYYYDISSFFNSIKSVDYNTEKFEAWDAKMVVLDEFGREGMESKTKDWMNMVLEQFLRHRIGSHLPTILVSNLKPAMLIELYGVRIPSLLGVTEDNTIRGLVYKSVEVKGGDFRTDQRGLTSRWER